MRLGLRLVRANGVSDDIVVTTDGSATVGEVADAIRRGDPSATAGPSSPGTRWTLGVVTDRGTVRRLRPDLPLGDEVLASGARVRPIEDTTVAASGVRAILRVHAGPDAGREWALGAGTAVIGRGRAAQISFSDPSVSQRHARLEVGESVELLDLASANGLRIDGEYVGRVRLTGVERIRAGETEFSILPRAEPALVSESLGAIRFNRAPRVEPRFPGGRHPAPAPPGRSPRVPFPWLGMLAPLAVGAVLLFLPGVGAMRFLLIAIAPLAVLGAFASQRTAQRRTRREAVARFGEELERLDEELAESAALERTVRNEEAPALASLVAAIRDRSPLLWTRRREHASFLALRLGTGELPSRSAVEPWERTDAERTQLERLRSVVERHRLLPGLPVVEDLRSAGALGVAGSAPHAQSVAAALVLQAVALHAPEDLCVATIVSKRQATGLDWLKWLPHVGGPRTPFSGPPLADSAAAAGALLAGLEALVEQRSGGGEPGSAVPAVLLLVSEDAPAERARLVRLLETGAAVGIHAIWVAERLGGLPAVCRTYLELDAVPDGAGAPRELGAEIGFVRTGERIRATVDACSPAEAALVADMLTSIVDASAAVAGAREPPAEVALADILGSDLLTTPSAIAERWRENDAVPRRPEADGVRAPRRPGKLRAAVGADADGPVHLDLRTQGPHALVGGTTGSGKSEFLRAWVLGMAAEASPERLAFLFIDYKGGSAFGDCADLPHCVGVVTDLDARLVARALTSLRAELRRRERLLAVRGHRDLAAFEASGDSDCPPMLVIVVDEFAALVADVPAFVDGIVDLAQRGRSLGIHLVMATQRPAGVVTENLRANTNLRVALRTADPQDSIDIVGVPTAASFELDRPGRAIVATGSGRRTLFQAAHVGAGSGARSGRPSIRVEPLRFGIVRPWARRGDDDPRPPSVDISAAFVAAARLAAEEAGIARPRRPWLDPLDDRVDLATLAAAASPESSFPHDARGAAHDGIAFGLLDDPAEQRRRVAAWRPDFEGNLAVFGAVGSGKSTLLRSIVVAATGEDGDGATEVYGIDCTAEGLRPLEALPDVGSIVAADDDERIRRLLGRLEAELERRAERIARAQAGSLGELRHAAGSSTPRILLLIDGMGELGREHELRGSRVFEAIRRLMSEGPKHGIHLLLSADRPAAVSASLLPSIGRRIALRLADEHDEHWLGVPRGLLPSPVPPGRGVMDGLELQVAVLGGRPGPAEQATALAAFAERRRAAGAAGVAPVERLPVRIPARVLPTAAGTAFIGIASDDLQPVGVEPEGAFLITGPPGSGRTTALRTLIRSTATALPGARFAFFGPERSPIRAQLEREGALEAGGDVGERARALLPLAAAPCDPAGGLVLVLEAAADLLGALSDPDLVALIRMARRSGHFVIAEGEVSTLAPSWPGLAELKGPRRGLVLHPDSIEVESVLRTRVPSARGPIIPGRGVLVEPTGPRVLQIAFCD